MSERFETVIIGGGQAGLAVGYHVAKAGRSFVVLEANDRIGDNWRNHYDALRLYSPARFNALPGWAGIWSRGRIPPRTTWRTTSRTTRDASSCP